MPSDWIEIINLSASVIGILGIPYLLLELYVQHLINTFSAVCRLPAPEVAGYNYVYKTIFNYYNLDKNTINDDLAVINKKYLFDCIREHYKTDKFKHFDKLDEKYLFSWDEIPGNDNERLIEFLIQKFGIDWVKIAKIEKIDDGKTIIVTTGKNFLSLRLNNEKTKANLKIDDCSAVEFTVKLENGKLNIYDEKYEKDYKFPLICKRNWLKSKCDNLKIVRLETEPLVDCEKISGNDTKKLEPEESKLCENTLVNNKLKESTKNFLSLFQIESFPDFLKLIGKEIWNDRTFDLYSITEEKNNTLCLQFVLGRYHNYVNYYELIAKELYFYLYYIEKSSIIQKYKRRLLLLLLLFKFKLYKPYRIRDSIKYFGISKIQKLKLFLRFSIKKDYNYLFEFKKRPVKLGINVFVLMKNDKNSYSTFIQKRKEKQVEYPGFYHVAPAGTFQPLSDYDENIINEQCKFEYTVLRELLEEVYDLEEADKKNKSVDPFNIFRLKNRKCFSPGKSLLSDKEIDSHKIPSKNNIYEIITTGFLIDLVTLKPELTVLLLIKDIEVYKKSKENVEGNWEGPVKEFVDIESDEFIKFLDQNLNIDKFLPAGAVALAEGLNYYFKNKQNF